MRRSLYVISAAVAIALTVGCANTRKPGETVQNSGAIVPSVPASFSNSGGLTREATNLYFRGKRVNFYTDTIAQVRSILGASKSSTTDNIDNKGNATHRLEDFGDVSVSYRIADGRLARVVMRESSSYVENGGRVGDSRDVIVKKYPGGFYRDVDGQRQMDSYYYLLMEPDGVVGVGFRFVFGKSDQVAMVMVGGFAFAP